MNEFVKLGDVAASIVDRLAKNRVRPASRDEWLTGRGKTIGASDLPALFGCHPYKTAFQLYAEKRGEYSQPFPEIQIGPDHIELPPHERGNDQEPVAFKCLQRLRPNWILIPNQIPGGFVFVDEDGLSTTPDLFAIDPGRGGIGAVQFKSVEPMIYARDWVSEHVAAPPLAVAVQTVADASLSGCSWAATAAFRVGFTERLDLFDVPLKPALMTKARTLVKDFWRRVREGDAYPPDYGRDGAVIASLYADAKSPQIDLSGNNRVAELVAQWEALKSIEKAGGDAEKQRKLLEVELMASLGNASAATIGGGRVLAAPTTYRKAYHVNETSYRAFSLIEPNGKKAKFEPATLTPASGSAPIPASPVSALPDSF